eukprot:2046895-Amphidinium_carterae.1
MVTFCYSCDTKRLDKSRQFYEYRYESPYLLKHNLSSIFNFGHRVQFRRAMLWVGRIGDKSP